MLSTPWGRRGFFHAIATASDADWERVTITARECPRITPEWLEAERQRMGDYFFAQEFECRFMETNDQLFSHESIMAALDNAIAPLFPEAA